ncbi:FBD / Leucine Rich Repeat domains containing protein [Striga asiatica]|uniref:FBD / Leucine Rich Repeat domains containing protein n=1 Tax=Striga asiatica TaxID=4170 RepID=A0A5A7P9G3_STRAF|nr:FBD / Leucine Rich Repeat domains containing protein [Striga asiatica]
MEHLAKNHTAPEKESHHVNWGWLKHRHMERPLDSRTSKALSISDLIEQSFKPEEAQMTLDIPLKPGQQDTMIWTPQKQGKILGQVGLRQSQSDNVESMENHLGTQDKEEDTSLPLEMLVSLLRNSRSINQKRLKCRPNLQRLHWEGMQQSNSSFRNWWSDICTMRKGQTFADQISKYLDINNTWKSEIDIAQGAWKEWTEFEEVNHLRV